MQSAFGKFGLLSGVENQAKVISLKEGEPSLSRVDQVRAAMTMQVIILPGKSSNGHCIDYGWANDISFIHSSRKNCHIT